MPSTLVSGHYNAGYLPPPTQLRDVECGWAWNRRSPGAEKSIGLSEGQGRTRLVAPDSCQQPQPPSKMTAVNDNQRLASNTGSRQQNGVSLVSSNAPPYPTPQPTGGSHSRQNNRAQPFYNSYYSAKQHRSPIPKRETAPSREQSIQRRSPNDANSIASHLQIPSSINNSKGSLPEFAAQITCLFWFEASVTLTLVEDARYPLPTPTSPLVPEAMPTTGFRKWVTTILSMTQVSQNVILLALMFIYRLKKLNPGVKGKIGSEFRLLTVALMLGNKFLDDNTYTNKTWADVSGISVQEIHVMEVEFLSNMRYTLYASHVEWDEWHVKLGRFAEYYDRASQIPAEFISQPLVLPAPRLTMGPNLPSPPVSQQSSPLYLPQLALSNQGLPHPLSIPPYIPSATSASPASSMPAADSRTWSRKRSLEDSSLEPPAKRMTNYVSSATSSTTLTPATLRDSTSPWKLPPPQFLNGPSAGPYRSPTQPHLQPPAGRAMASIFPNQTRLSQRGPLPSLQPPHYLGQQGGMTSGSPLPLQSQSQAPYSHDGTTPSPTAYHFSHHHTPSGLSPSDFPAPRNSPYKPVRGVNTLLVPPPSTSVQNAPQQLSYDQMHYQPIGRPSSERRTGVLPFHPFYTWSDNAHQMQHQLPPPLLPS
ncbi:MAG: hypothetical protein Q9217_005254 [Psora testacea]